MINESVTGAWSTSIIPTPETSPVLIGDAPIKLSPSEVNKPKTAPLVDGDDCVATHQFIAYLPVSLKVITPVTSLYDIFPSEYTTLSNITAEPLSTEFGKVRSICKAILLIFSPSIKFN